MGQGKGSQAFIVAEYKIMLKVDGCSIFERLYEHYSLRTMYLCELPPKTPTAGTHDFLYKLTVNEPAMMKKDSLLLDSNQLSC